MKKLLTITGLVLIGGIIALFLFSSIGYRDTTIARQNHIQESYNQNRSHLAGYAVKSRRTPASPICTWRRTRSS